MKCPVCHYEKQEEIHLHSDQFCEDIVICVICGTSWSFSHEKAEVINDAQKYSFLEGTTECVESDDYN